MEKTQTPTMFTTVTLALIPIVMVLGNSMLVPVLPTMEKTLNVTKFQTSLLITLFSLSAGIIIPIVGYLADRFKRKMIIGISLLVYGIGGIVSGLAAWLMKDSYSMILVGRIIQGIGAAGTSPIAMALIGDLYKGGGESRALGINEAANGLGKILSPILGSLIALITWYAVFFVFPIFCFIVAALTWFVIKEPKAPEAKPLPKYINSLKNIFAQKGKWLVPALLVGATGLFILFGVLFYLSNLLEDDYNVDGVLKGGILAIPLLGLVTTSYFTGSKIKQNKPLIRTVMLTGIALLTASVLIVSFFENIYVIVGLLTVSSVGTGLLLPCLNTLITGAINKPERGMITSLYGSVRFIGVAIGPPLFGWLMDISHRTLFFTVTAISAVSLVVTFFFINPAQNKGQQGQGGRKTPAKDKSGRRQAKAPT